MIFIRICSELNFFACCRMLKNFTCASSGSDSSHETFTLCIFLVGTGLPDFGECSGGVDGVFDAF